MSVSWQKLRVPLMERLALADMAERLGKSEEDTLKLIIREAVKRDLASDKPRSQAVPDAAAHE
jgi:hypothetical protein